MALAARLVKRAAQEAPGPSASKARLEAAVPPLTVGDVAGRQGDVRCPGSAALGDVADLLIEGGRSAAAVLDEQGSVLGAITENDIVRAYAEGTEQAHRVTAAAWLQGSLARCPCSEEVTVPASTPLHVAAEALRARALADGGRRHLIVLDDVGQLQGVLSSLDVARALCGSMGIEELQRRVAGARVEDVMKPFGTLAAVPRSASLLAALQAMQQSGQNCVIVTDGAGVLGVVTPRDALRAFADHASLETPVGHWLRGLGSALAPRQVGGHEELVEAAGLMAALSLHHLLVISGEGDSHVVGVLSASDVAQAMGSPERAVPGFEPMED